jgi:glutathione peroxidase
MSALEEIPVSTIDGKGTTLGGYGGKVRLIVNVASQCGLTPQYTALEAVYRRFKGRGFEVLAFPANEFGAQEPGTNEEIKDFCSTKYDVSFPLFAKIVVRGPGQHPLYAQLTTECPEARALPGTDFRGKLMSYGLPAPGPGEILWNFEKFLVDKNGRVIGRFSPDVPPDADIVVSEIERALAS